MSSDEKAGIIQRLEGLIAFFEKDRFSLISGTLLLLSYILVRGLFEWTLFKTGDDIYVGLYNAYQAGFVFTLMFASGILVMALISRIKVKTITNVVLIGFVFSVMGPLMDRFLFGRTVGYEYVSFENFTGAGPGLVIQLVLIGTFGGLYVGIKTESVKHAGATLAGLMGCMFFMGMIPTYIFETLQKANFQPDERQAAVAVILFVLTIAVAAFLVYVADTRIPRTLLKHARLRFTFLLVAISFVGLAIAGRVFIIPQQDEAVTIVANDLPFAMLLSLTVIFGCQFLFALDNTRKPQRGAQNPGGNDGKNTVMTQGRFRQYAGFCAVISVGLSATLGPLSFLVVIIFVPVSLSLFSLLHASKVGISLAAGISGLLMYLTGFLASTTKIQDSEFIMEPFKVRYPGSGAISPAVIDAAAGVIILVVVAIIWYFLETNHKEIMRGPGT